MKGDRLTMRNKIPVGAKHIIYTLESYGHHAYLVGGCVRDLLMGRQPHDWDICTSATPDEMKKCFVNWKLIETGLKHGTITVWLENESFEVTTFRVDGHYTDGRRPDDVQFTKSLIRDLLRRDFTINAIAMSADGTICDPLDGQLDIKNRVIRCVNNPRERFDEDGLRIMRAMRFSSVLGFKIEPNTAASIHDCVGNLEHIASERINTELCKMLTGDGVLDVLLDYSDVISFIIPELKPCIGFDQKNKYHQYTVYDHIAHAVANDDSNDLTVKIALLLHDIGKPCCVTEDENGRHFHGHGVFSRDLAEQVLTRLRFDTKTKHDVLELVLFHDATMDPTVKVVRRWLNKIGPEQFERLLHIRIADMLAHTEGTQKTRIERWSGLKTLFTSVMAEQQCFSLKDLAVNGRDMMMLGIPEGPEVGAMLHKLMDLVLDGEAPNEKYHLIGLAVHMKAEKELLHDI